MKAILLTLSLLLAWDSSFSQVITMDPLVSSAQLAHANIMNSQLNTTRDKLTLIQQGQLAVTGQLLIVNKMQSKIYKGLSQVSSILSNLYEVKEIGNISLGMVSDINQGLELAKQDPALLLFAESQANQFYLRAGKLAIEVNQFALKGGEDNLMDSGERSKLISHVVSEMLILRALTYGMYRAMYYAKLRGLWKSLNPFQDFVNIDHQLEKEIIFKRRMLK